MTELDEGELAGVTGGISWDTVKGGFGLRTLYRGAVKNATAAIGGYELANQMYGTKDHRASWHDVWRARGALKGYLDGSDKLPSWAPQW